jgi:SPP1 gp7 family putative phage head morphogenesis protein
MDEELFRTAPKAVIDYFDRRPSVPTFDWRDIAAHEHALAHTVAKTAGFDVLDDIRKAVRKAVVDRVPFEQFRDELIPLLKARGWWGEQRRIDPVTKRPVDAQLGSLRRLRIIYWANMHSAHAAGEWSRIQETKTFLPWLTYVSSVSERKRPLHLSWVGTTLPVDDPWWRSHYPPNGWNCKCSVRQVGDREADRLHTRYAKRTAPPLDERSWLNKRTGETEMIPAGIDPGWQTNAGMLRDRTLGRGLQGALDRMDEPARREAVATLRRHPIFDYVARNRAGFIYPRPAGDIENTAKGHFRAAVAVLSNVLGDAVGARTSIVSYSVSDAAKQLAKRRRADGTEQFSPADYELVQSIIDEATEAIEDRGKWRLQATIGGKRYLVVLKIARDGKEIFLNSFRRDD